MIAHQINILAVANTAPENTLVINGVEINKPLSEYDPSELGIHHLSCIAYNNLKDDVPEIAKLSIVNDNAFTEYMILKDDNPIEVAYDYITDAFDFCAALADISGDYEIVETCRLSEQLFEKFLKDRTTYDELESSVAEIAGRNLNYAAVTNVLLTALKVVFKK